MAAEALRSFVAALQTLALTNRLRLQAEQIVARASRGTPPASPQGSFGGSPCGVRITFVGQLFFFAPRALGAAEKFQVLAWGPL